MRVTIIITLLMGLLIMQPASAQITINLYILQNFQFRPVDMFNADIQNGAVNSSEIYFTGSIDQTRTGDRITDVRTGNIIVNPGITHLDINALNAQFSFASSEISQNSFLAYGNYRVCVKAYSALTNEELSSTCEDVELTAISPPSLLMPENQSIVYEDYPLLMWLPPVPIGKDKVLYDLKLVELMPNQTPYDAIQKNVSQIEIYNITGTVYQYPASSIPLENDKIYVWQVKAKTQEGQPLGDTEVWTFTRKNKLNQEDENPVPVKDYTKLKTERNTDYIYVKDKLKFIYEERYGKVKIIIKLKDQQGNEIFRQESDADMGENRKTLDLEYIKGLKAGAIYFMEVSADGRPSVYLAFKNIK